MLLFFFLVALFAYVVVRAFETTTVDFVLPPDGVHSLSFHFGLVIAVLVIWRHRENIARLGRGTERRFEWQRKAES